MNDDQMIINELKTLAHAEAVEMFEGDQRAAEQWLSLPARGLGNHTPDSLMGSKEGIAKVRTLIGQLERGVLP
jgi:putative toxin-antitoxin system antitoxin component (TIGR02293 family)